MFPGQWRAPACGATSRSSPEKKKWRRVTITSLPHRVTSDACTKWAVCNAHCINGHQKRKIPGDAEKAKA